MKILFLTGSRGEWGYIRPILKKCSEFGVEYSICATNMHLVSAYGRSIDEIIRDGFEVKYPIYMAIDGYDHFTMSKSLGVFLASFSDVLMIEKPDWILLAGDRGEQLVGAIAGAFTYTPVAHIQAGELSGNIDGMTRHAIGKYAHLHFAANNDAYDRLIKLGEEEFRVHLTGAPQLDELVNGEVMDLGVFKSKYSLLDIDKFILFVQHPVTEDFEHADEQIRISMGALNKFDIPKLVILPNNDAGSSSIKSGIFQYRKGRYHLFSNLERSEYLALLKNCLCIVGNSSSGLLEAPTFGTPAVNIGRRQNGRIRGVNVIDVEFDEKKIVEAIDKSLSSEFQQLRNSGCVNPYGDGNSSERIITILKNTRINDKLLVKNLTY